MYLILLFTGTETVEIVEPIEASPDPLPPQQNFISADTELDDLYRRRALDSFQSTVVNDLMQKFSVKWEFENRKLFIFENQQMFAEFSENLFYGIGDGREVCYIDTKSFIFI